MKSESIAVRGTVLCAILALVACGGGGGASLPSTTSNVTTLSSQRAVASSALSATGESTATNAVTSSTGPELQALQQFGGHGHDNNITATILGVPGVPDFNLGFLHHATGTCHNGITASYSTSAGTTTVSFESFYDAACTYPHRSETLTITPPASGSNTGTAVGTAELWSAPATATPSPSPAPSATPSGIPSASPSPVASATPVPSGSVVAYETFSLAYTVDANGHLVQVTRQSKHYANPTDSVPYAQRGYTCLFTQPPSVNCGYGNALNLSAASLSVGFVATVTSAQSPSPSPSPTGSASPSPSPSSSPTGEPGDGWYGGGLEHQSVTINGMGYSGAFNALTLAPATAPAWSITGGTQIVGLTGTARIDYDDGGMVSAGVGTSITITDSVTGLTASLTGNGHGRLTGTVTGGTLTSPATISVDRSGSGTITYSDGTTGIVRDWVILN